MNKHFVKPNSPRIRTMKSKTIFALLCFLLISATNAFSLPVEHLMRALQERGEAINQNRVNGGLSPSNNWPIDWDALGSLVGEQSVPDYPEDGFFDDIYLNENYESKLVQIVERIRDEVNKMRFDFIYVPIGNIPEVLSGENKLPEAYSQLDNDIFNSFFSVNTTNYIEAFGWISERICDYKYLYLAYGGDLSSYLRFSYHAVSASNGQCNWDFD